MKQRLRNIVGFIVLAVLLVVVVLWNINTGSVQLSIGEVVELLLHGNPGTLEGNIIWKIRLPRLLGCMVLGGALAIAGFLLQTFFKNPIAGPFVLGISSGAKLFVGFFMLAAVPIYKGSFSPYMVFAAAFAGAMVSMGLALLFAGRVQNLAMLLVVGMMIGYLCSAGTDLMVTFAQANNIQYFTLWSMGSFSGMTWTLLRASTAIVLPTCAVVFLLSKPLHAYLLGENYAKGAGVNVRLFRHALVVLSSVLAACVTAFAGPISFVGIAVPHITRMLFKTALPRVLIPAAFLTGSVFCLFCDLLARTLFSPIELPISTVTATFGAPIVIWLMVKRRKDG